MPAEPIIKRGNRYYCPTCGHMMDERLPSCSKCHAIFDGMVEEKIRDAEHPPTPEEMELVEEIDAMENRDRVWMGIGVFVIVLLAILVLFLICRR